MKTKTFIANLADNIIKTCISSCGSGMKGGADHASADGVVTMHVELTYDPDYLARLLDVAFEQNDLEYEECVTLMALCLHKINDIPMNEAIESARNCLEKSE